MSIIDKKYVKYVKYKMYNQNEKDDKEDIEEKDIKKNGGEDREIDKEKIKDK